MNAILFITVLALVSPIFGEEAVETKNHEKRGTLGLGYGLGYGSGLGGLGHGGYLASSSYSLGHGIAAAPLASAPLAHGAPLYSGAGLGRGLGYHG